MRQLTENEQLARKERWRVNARKYYALNREKIIQRSAAWQKENPEKNKRNRKAEYLRNKERKLSYQRTWRAGNKDKWQKQKQREYSKHRNEWTARRRKWYQQNKEHAIAYSCERRARLKKVGGKFTAADIKRLLIAQKHKCNVCHKDLATYHVDHIMPISRGGNNWPSNIQILCPSCNLRKHAKHPAEFMAEIRA